MKRRYAVLAPGHFRYDAKTAHGVIAYADDETAVVIDPDCAEMRVCDAVPYLRCEAPIVATLDEALRYAPTTLLIGTAPKGGALPASWREEIRSAIGAGLDVVSGLHDFLGDDPEFRAAAERSGATIRDVRKPPDVPIFSGRAYGVRAPVVLFVGNDCAVGKMTVAIELTRAARNAGVRAEFVPTGQTGIMIAGWGIAVDRVIADFAPGAAESIVCEAAARDAELIFVEGQGALNHPAYAPVTLSLMLGCAPDALILVCDPSRRTIAGYDTPALGYRELIDLHERVLATVKPARVTGIALNTAAFDDARARAEIARASAETSLPAADVVRYGAADFYAAACARIEKRLPVRLGGGT